MGRALEPLCGALLPLERFAGCERRGRELIALRQTHYSDDHWVTWSGAAYVAATN